MQITKTKCPEDLRLDFLPKQFGFAVVGFELSLYYWAEQLMEGYKGWMTSVLYKPFIDNYSI